MSPSQQFAEDWYFHISTYSTTSIVYIQHEKFYMLHAIFELVIHTDTTLWEIKKVQNFPTKNQKSWHIYKPICKNKNKPTFLLWNRHLKIYDLKSIRTKNKCWYVCIFPKWYGKWPMVRPRPTRVATCFWWIIFLWIYFTFHVLVLLIRSDFGLIG